MKKLVCVLAVLSLLASGCGTIISGFRTTQDVQVSSIPPGANVRSTDGQMATTPCAIRLSRSRSHMLTFEMDGYEPAQSFVGSSFNAWTLGNVVFLPFVLIPVGIDLIDGCAWTLDEQFVSVSLRRSREDAPRR